MTTTRPAKPMIFDENTEIPGDALTTFESVEVEGGKLKEGMLLLDPEFGCPLILLDTKKRGSHGAALFLVHDLDRSRIVDMSFHLRFSYPVATKVAES